MASEAGESFSPVRENPPVRERILYHQENLIRARDNYTRELERAQKGESSSLSYIKHPVPTPMASEGDQFQAFVIGGTNFKSAIYKVEEGKAVEKEHMEGNFGILETKDDLVSIISASLSPEITKLGINFAYPMDPVSRGSQLDGKLLRATKEHKLIGLVGQNVGETIEKDLDEITGTEHKTNVANDTVCLWLAGEEGQGEAHVAGIVGTGLNFAIGDQGSIINLESANFNKFTPTDTGKKVDDASSSPGASLAEKEIAGAYLYQHFNMLSKEFEVDPTPIRSTEVLSEIAAAQTGTTSEIAQALIERSASLTAVQIAGIYKYKNLPNLTFTMEGSLFWKGTGYKKAVEDYLTVLGVPDGAITFKEVESSDLTGAAKLVSH